MKKLSLLLASAVCTVTANAQWNTNPMENNLIVPQGTSHYAREMNMAPDGTAWFMYYHPNLKEATNEYDTDNAVYEYRVQAIDPEGNRKFGDELGLLISDYPARSWCVVNKYTAFDRKGNFILVVHDCRNSADGDALSYTAYKISPDGKMLWDEDGVMIDGGMTCDTSAAMSLTVLDDNSVVFAWMRDNNGVLCVEMQRVSEDGQVQWNLDDVALRSDTTPYSYPYVVNAGNNQFILVYGRGTSSDLYARKIDFDGTLVWEKDTRIYRGGWGSIPLWTKLSVVPSGDGGVLLGWNDDRDSDNTERPYMSYVKADGSLGFSAASPEGDVRLSWAEMQSWQIKIMPDPDNDGFLALWRSTDSNQAWEHPVIQRVSKSGELLFGDEGIALGELMNTTYGYMSLQPGQDGSFAAFWMEQKTGFGDVTAYCQTFDIKTGTPQWEEPFVFTPAVRERSNLTSFVCRPEKYWITYWTDGGTFGSPEDPDLICIQRINFDKTYGSAHSSAIESVSTSDNSFSYSNGAFKVSLIDSALSVISIYDLSGKLIDIAANVTLQPGLNSIPWIGANPGIFVARIQSGNYSETIKVALK